ncbi:MAG: ABC transporter substrate-binding protein [Oscillibacter sp.]|jgi:branched-chain amino acid transport system substrate-binding protein|nr:ABC transporter substrate-binding protein [Dysosmobacter sp.]MDD6409420.1 ABC transporter substrate-binding protein [Oscillibacter sp.]MDY3867343.1 ABC transporter substrate-binding protein [Dysosmobacter sp.]
MKKKNTLSLMLAGCLALSLTACGGQSESGAGDADSSAPSGDGTITLGMIGPLTGSVAVYGTHIENGVKLAIEEINAAGGVTLSDGAHQLAVETKDDQGDATECVNAMNALISDGIQLVVGSATSGCTSAITSIANSEGVVMITPSGTADSLTTAMDYVFRTCFRDSFQGELAAQYALDEGYTKVGVVYCSADTYSAGLRDAFIAACADRGLDVVAEESVATMTEVDYTNQFNKMVAAGAELVFTPFYYDVMGPYLVPQARSAGFTGVLLGGDGVDSTETTIPDGADLSVYNDVYFVNHYSTELATSDVSKNFIESYEAKYGETPNNFDALAYDAVYVYKAAMEACGASDAASVQAALADTSAAYDSTCGTFSFDETGTPIKNGVLMGYSYKDGDSAVSKITVKALSLS